MSSTHFEIRAFLGPGKAWDSIVRMVLLVPIVCSWMGLFGGWHWFLHLFSHFRWQYLLASVVAVAWAAWRRQRKVLVLAVITLLLNTVLIGQLAWHPRMSRDAVSDDFRLRVLSLNVLTSNTRTQAVLDQVLASDADVVFLMEVNQRSIAALAGLKEKYSPTCWHALARTISASRFSAGSHGRAKTCRGLGRLMCQRSKCNSPIKGMNSCSSAPTRCHRWAATMRPSVMSNSACSRTTSRSWAVRCWWWEISTRLRGRKECGS